MDCCAVLDLRQYTLYDGRRDDLITLFDREFVEGQEAYGMHVCGQFRDLDDENQFVWLRGFASLDARAEALRGFYSGPVWKAHSAEANATMKDSDNALLLRPLALGADWPALDSPRLPVNAVPEDAVEARDTVVAGAVYHRVPNDDGFVEFFTERVEPALADAGVRFAGIFETLPVENNFPALPLRDETVLVWVAVFADDTAYQQHRARLAKSASWAEIAAELERRCSKPTQELRLRPTTRSQLGRQKLGR
ncbi:NIPSNAP family containing protein [Kribbella sp. ALI-6-A]|uniref:NIPSNAP family protein n=1 Tax=Kribbella sp. ALI-6-A TaxID=1933817 RepID=UPI00097C7291|nr:NIPSNAP family protein [Kribbella sp. ALI-6-A]ONI66996.1 NIPSNAP family containing protein [Kribbella sp. ALI-6-A]